MYKIEKILRKKSKQLSKKSIHNLTLILTICRIIVSVYAKNLAVTQIFVGFSKAFDSVRRGKMEQILLYMISPKKLLLL